MRLTITNLSTTDISCEAGLVPVNGQLVADLSPERAYKIAAAMKSLQDAGKVTCSVAPEAALLDSLEPGGTLPTGVVKKANTAMFISAEQTGTGSSQNVAHGLGAIPTAVFVVPTDLTPATVGQYSCVEGTHDGTNVKVTVTASKKFKVMAWL